VSNLKMNHIGAKTDTASTAWDQLAQTQNYDHPLMRQQPQPAATVSKPTLPPPPPSPATATNSQSVQPAVNPQTPAPTEVKPPEYGEELHPELVSVHNWNLIVITINILFAGASGMEKILVEKGKSTVLLEQNNK
jgi:hypothetical protein